MQFSVYSGQEASLLEKNSDYKLKIDFYYRGK